MSAHNDVADLERRLDSLVRSAARIRANAADLHDLGWERMIGEAEKVNGGDHDRAPRAGLPRARQLFGSISVEVGRMEAELVGLERSMVGLFFAGSTNPEPSRGSMISRAEFDRLRERQRVRGGHTRLVQQPEHPGKRP